MGGLEAAPPQAVSSTPAVKREMTVQVRRCIGVLLWIAVDAKAAPGWRRPVGQLLDGAAFNDIWNAVELDGVQSARVVPENFAGYR